MADPALKNDDYDIDIDFEEELEVIDDTPEEDRGKHVATDTEGDSEEGPSEEELKSYSENVQKRIKSLTAAKHSERRAKEAAARELEEAANAAKALLEENNRLKEIVSKGETFWKKTAQDKVTAQLEQARNEFKAAYDEGDAEKIALAQEKISKLAVELDKATSWRPQPLQPSTMPQRSQPRPKVDEKAEDWQEKNPWFGKDTVRTAFALGVHKKLLDENGPDYASDPGYYKKIDSELRARFPEEYGIEKEVKSNGGAQRGDDVVVAPAKRSGSGKGRKITLTQSQVSLARRLGLTPQQYAEGVLEMEKSND